MDFWNNKRVLITGGAGFIGSHLCLDLLKEGSNITVVDNLERGTLEIIGDKISQITFYNLDLSNKKNCEKLFSNSYDIVFHFASKVGGIGYYTSKPYEVIEKMTNVDSNILNLILRQKNKPLYFYASSAHVYPIELQGTPDSKPICENQAFPANPELSYGWAKLYAEKQIQFAAKEYCDLKVAIGRYIGIYGPGQDFDLSTGSVIPVFSYRSIKYPQIPFSIWGTGKETRSYCYVDDAVECTKLMVEKLATEHMIGPLNIGKQERISIREIAENIIEICGKDVIIEYDLTKPTLIWGQWCDCNLAEKVLDGWKAKTSFKEGLLKTYIDISKRVEHDK